MHICSNTSPQMEQVKQGGRGKGKGEGEGKEGAKEMKERAEKEADEQKRV
jgi:hypothetical protein